MRIAIGVHTTDNVDATVYFNHVMMVSKWAKEHDLAFIGLRRVKIEQACNLTVQTAWALGCTHVLFVDDDHILREDMLPLLLENADAAVVSGLICQRLFPYTVVAFRRDGDGKLQQLYLDAGQGVREVDGCAFGCTLVNLEKLKTLPMPWFETVQGARFDVNFFNKVRAAGERILVDTRVSVGHISDPEVVWPENATELRAIRIQHVQDSRTDIV